MKKKVAGYFVLWHCDSFSSCGSIHLATAWDYRQSRDRDAPSVRKPFRSAIQPSQRQRHLSAACVQLVRRSRRTSRKVRELLPMQGWIPRTLALCGCQRKDAQEKITMLGFSVQEDRGTRCRRKAGSALAWHSLSLSLRLQIRRSVFSSSMCCHLHPARPMQ